MPVLLRALRQIVVPLIVAGAMIATTLGLTPPATAAPRQHHRILHGLAVARAQIGDPYRYGAAGPNAFDCSGLVYYSYHKAGFKKVPRTSSAQAHFMKRIKRNHMRRGDFVFFYGSGGVYHVAIYTGIKHGHRTILHASHTGTPVKRDRIWTNSWFAGTLRRK